MSTMPEAVSEIPRARKEVAHDVYHHREYGSVALGQSIDWRQLAVRLTQIPSSSSRTRSSLTRSASTSCRARVTALNSSSARV